MSVARSFRINEGAFAVYQTNVKPQGKYSFVLWAEILHLILSNVFLLLLLVWILAGLTVVFIVFYSFSYILGGQYIDMGYVLFAFGRLRASILVLLSDFSCGFEELVWKSFKIGQDRFIQHYFQFITYNLRHIRRYITYAVDKSALNKQRTA